MSKAGTLYIVATPIGNLEDITFRAIEILKNIDLIACEDTRVTRRLLERYDIKKELISYHQHSKLARVDQLISELKSGKNIALLTDAGTPGISDPGNKLVEEVVKEGIRVEPIPGPSALTALVSVSGIDMHRFVFLGFPPHKKGRETFFKEVISHKYPVVYYESVHRVLKNLDLLRELGCEKNVILGREITKIFEEIVRDNIEGVISYFKEKKDKIKGEFVIIIH